LKLAVIPRAKGSLAAAALLREVRGEELPRSPHVLAFERLAKPARAMKGCPLSPNGLVMM